jgi:hypothetical protein
MNDVDALFGEEVRDQLWGRFHEWPTSWMNVWRNSRSFFAEVS